MIVWQWVVERWIENEEICPSDNLIENIFATLNHVLPEFPIPSPSVNSSNGSSVQCSWSQGGFDIEINVRENDSTILISHAGKDLEIEYPKYNPSIELEKAFQEMIYWYAIPVQQPENTIERTDHDRDR